jgi:hypothetical protein
LTLHAPKHNDHPGVTLQILGAAVEWLKWFGGFLLSSRQSLNESVLSQPESYLHAMNSAVRWAFSAQRPARDRAFTRIPDSPPRRAALCAESVES